MNSRTDTYSSLAKWAILGKQLREVNEQTGPSWLPVKRMISATKPILQANRAEARRLLKASNQLFAPFTDPFEMELGLHRWLSGEREEAYSDWLAWVIEQLATPENIIHLLCGESDGALLRQCSGPLKVYRETVFVTAESVRRTDIEICFGQKRAVLIEVKMIDADQVIDQQLRDESHYGSDFEKRLLLVLSGEAPTSSNGFALLLWRDICLRLRRLVPSICRQNLSVTAMVLGFLSAVEQNVLHLPAANDWRFVTSQTLDYLAESLGKDNADARSQYSEKCTGL
jgi:hypothetical protein